MKMISRIYSTSDAFMWFSHYKRCFCFFIIYYFFPFRVLIAVSWFQSVFLFLLWLEYAIHIWFVLLCWIPLFFPSLRSFLFMFLNNKSIYDPSCIWFISNGLSIIHVNKKKISLLFFYRIRRIIKIITKKNPFSLSNDRTYSNHYWKLHRQELLRSMLPWYQSKAVQRRQIQMFFFGLSERRHPENHPFQGVYRAGDQHILHLYSEYVGTAFSLKAIG